MVCDTDPEVDQEPIGVFDRIEKRVEKYSARDVKRYSVKFRKYLTRHFHEGKTLRSYVSTGLGGLALMYFKVGKGKRGLNFIRKAMKRRRKSSMSFLMGEAGLLALGAVLQFHHGSVEQFMDNLERLKHKVIFARTIDPSIPSNLICGRAGFLFALLFVNYYVGPDTVGFYIIRSVVRAILRSGQIQAQRDGSEAPLNYAWGGSSRTLGAAKGLVGVLYILLQAQAYLSDVELESLIRPSLDYIITVDENTPIYRRIFDEGHTTWCTGIAGAVHLFCEAFQVFNDYRYLNIAIDFGDRLWEEGDARPDSMSHGVIGYAYCMLKLYQTVGSPEYLRRAEVLASLAITYSNQLLDCYRDYCLYSGLAGVIYLLDDMQNPEKSDFPGYSLSGKIFTRNCINRRQQGHRVELY